MLYIIKTSFCNYITILNLTWQDKLNCQSDKTQGYLHTRASSLFERSFYVSTFEISYQRPKAFRVPVGVMNKALF